MAYDKNTWVDQSVERPRTYEMTNNADGSVTLIDSFGLVDELGTPVNADNMNHIEEGIQGCAIRYHNLTEIFDNGEWVKSGDKLYKSLQDQNQGHEITETNYWEELSPGGSSFLTGQLISSTIPLIEDTLHKPDGTLLSGSGTYADFVSYITNAYNTMSATEQATCFTTEEKWQSDVSTYGVCRQYVLDTTNNTLRLPLIKDIIKGGESGDVTEAGLPNITGSWSGTMNNSTTAQNGAAINTYSNGYGAGREGASSSNLSFDASLSNAIYGNSDTVQPQSVDVYYYIVVGTVTKTDVEINIDNIVTDLNGKAEVDLSNVNASQTFKENSVSWGIPDYTAGISLTSYTTSSNQFTCPTDGFVSLGYRASNRPIINNIAMGSYNTGDYVSGAYFFVEKGTKIYCANYYQGDNKFYPLKGVN